MTAARKGRVSSFLLVAAMTIGAQVLSLPARLALVVAAERIPVPVVVKAQDFVVEPLTASIELRRVPNPKVVAARMGLAAGQICSDVSVNAANTVVIRCKTKRFEAHLVVERGKMYIEIEQLRGFPWGQESDRLDVFYDPETTGFGAACPGDTPVGRAECALHDGRIDEARELFHQAQSLSSQASFAGVRLGDLALAAGDVGGAMTYYKRASYGDLFGHLAVARLCELDGNCLAHGAERVFAVGDRPEPVRSELLLRGARVALMNDQYAAAGHVLAQAIADQAVGACADLGKALCRRMLQVVLDHVTGNDAVEAVESYLALPDRENGPMAMQLMHTAAEKAASIGAPGFAANLLAAHATTAEGPGLGEHLLRTAEFYLQADDLVRARVVLDYADTRLNRATLQSARWAAVRTHAQTGDGEVPASALAAFEILSAESVRDLAQAYSSMARARMVQQ
jgi:hypothetical protein